MSQSPTGCRPVVVQGEMKNPRLRITSILKSLFATCLVLMALAVPSGPVLAYGSDVHFNLTYTMARLSGIDRNDALWIALGDESMDHNRFTTAYGGSVDAFLQLTHLHRFVWTRNGKLWHAFTDVSASNAPLNDVVTTMRYDHPERARAAIAARRDELWHTALDSTPHGPSGDRLAEIRADIAFGQFLHFEQDYYAHRQFGHELDGEDWLPYGPFRGHSADGHSPDYVALRQPLAREMLIACDAYLEQWQRQRGMATHPVSPALISELISRVSMEYDPRAMQYPSHRYHDSSPTQNDTDRAINAILLEHHLITVHGDSLYHEGIFSVNLPYDKPTTSLRSIEEQIGEPVRSKGNIPFAHVLTGRFLSP